MKLRKTAAAAAIFVVSCSMCLAHGVDHTVLKGGVGVEAKYDSGQAMAYCEAKVFSPTNAETESQQ